MNTRHYAEFNQQTISQLKVQGYTSVQFLLLDHGDPYQATVEVLPLKSSESGLDIVSLHSREIDDYLDGDGGMVKYVIGVGSEV